MTFEEALGMYALRANPTLEEDKFHVAVITTLFGQCYSDKVNAPSQVLKRAQSAFASKKIKVPDLDLFRDFFTRSGFECGWPNEDCVALMGITVAMMSPTRSDINAQITELCPISILADRYKWKALNIGLYSGYQLVAQNSHSQTLRIAIQGLTSFEAVRHLASTDIIMEADILKKTAEIVEKRPYVSCASPISPQFLISSQKKIVAYGLLVFKANCSGDELVKFEKYAIDAILNKLDHLHLSEIEVLVQNTPKWDDMTYLNMIERASLVTAEAMLARLEKTKADKIKMMILNSERPSQIGNSLKREEKTAAKARVLQVALTNLDNLRTELNRKLNQMRRRATANNTMDAYNGQKRVLVEELRQLTLLVNKQDDDWMASVTEADRILHSVLVENVKGRMLSLAGALSDIEDIEDEEDLLR